MNPRSIRWLTIFGGLAASLGGLIVIFLQESPRPTNPGQSSQSAPPPNVSTGDASSATTEVNKRNSTGVDVADDFFSTEDRERAKPPSLKKAKSSWVSEAEATIAKIRSETFVETLRNTASFKENYFKLVHAKASPSPSNAGFLYSVYQSRRWARLVESIKQDKSYIATVVRQLKSDIDLLEESVNFYGSIMEQRSTGNGSVTHTRADEDKPLLVTEIGSRMTVEILLLGEMQHTPAADTVVDAVEVWGSDTNWSAVGYTSDRILDAMAETPKGKPQAQSILDEYRRWKRNLSYNSPFFLYDILQVPAFDSPQRPGDRAVAMGAKPSEGPRSNPISFAAAPRYNEFPLMHKDEWYSEHDARKDAKKLYEFLKRIGAVK